MSPPTARKRATIRDVGRVARVSHQTVSRVINGENGITPWTRARVEQAIASSGFRPSHIARSLVSRSTKTIGLVMGDVASPFFPDVVRGAEDVLSEAGYCLILSNSRRDPERELRNVRHLLERSTDGLILGAPQGPPDELGELAERAAVPMVFLNRDVAGAHVASVWIDWRAATAEIVTYLAGLGHRRVGLVVPSREETPGRQPRGLVSPGARPRRSRSRPRAGLPGAHVDRGRATRPAGACSRGATAPPPRSATAT